MTVLSRHFEEVNSNNQIIFLWKRRWKNMVVNVNKNKKKVQQINIPLGGASRCRRYFHVNFAFVWCIASPLYHHPKTPTMHLFGSYFLHFFAVLCSSSPHKQLKFYIYLFEAGIQLCKWRRKKNCFGLCKWYTCIICISGLHKSPIKTFTNCWPLRKSWLYAPLQENNFDRKWYLQ